MLINTSMSARILTFPSKDKVREKPTTLRLPLYTDVEIETVMVCCNVYSMSTLVHTYADLTNLDPSKVIEYLNLALKSSIFSIEFKVIIQDILDNVEVIE